MSRPYGELAAAIVRQAVKDWKEGDEFVKAECEQFFESGFYLNLRELAPDVIPENMMGRLER